MRFYSIFPRQWASLEINLSLLGKGTGDGSHRAFSTFRFCGPVSTQGGVLYSSRRASQLLPPGVAQIAFVEEPCSAVVTHESSLPAPPVQPNHDRWQEEKEEDPDRDEQPQPLVEGERCLWSVEVGDGGEDEEGAQVKLRESGADRAEGLCLHHHGL